jgi:hypothetical protein
MRSGRSSIGAHGSGSCDGGSGGAGLVPSLQELRRLQSMIIPSISALRGDSAAPPPAHGDLIKPPGIIFLHKQEDRTKRKCLIFI